MKISAVISRFPDHELAVHRLCGQDSGFREICEDYEEALVALRHWEQAGPAYATRAVEYRQIIGEIEADIQSELSTHLQRVPARREPISTQQPQCTTTKSHQQEIDR
ncbi:hypothetical protein [Sedimentitalea sp.]|uniref:hypothetical protein n=1 Tax=Sedimentitalea sp. TaxID=2048915 RepID=UPI0032987216